MKKFSYLELLLQNKTCLLVSHKIIKMIFLNFLIVFAFSTFKESQCAYIQDEPNSLNPNHFYSKSLIVKEELVIDEIVEEPNFQAPTGVKRWLKLNVGHQNYILGIMDKGLTLFTVYRRHSNIIKATEEAINFSDEIVSASIFKITKLSGRLESYLLLAFNEPTPKILWFKIESLKLHQIYEWKLQRKIQEILHFSSSGEDDKILIVEKDPAGVMIYQLQITVDLPHIWFVENLPIENNVKEPKISKSKNTVYLSMIEDQKLAIFRYEQFCSTSEVGKFVRAQTKNEIKGFKNLEWFESRGNTYLATSGGLASLFVLDGTGNLELVKKFGNRMELVIMPHNNDRDDVMILAKSENGDVHLFSQKESENIEWVEKAAPKCLKVVEQGPEIKKRQDFLSNCIGQNRTWYGALYLDSSDFPFLLFADQKYEGESFMIVFSLRPVAVDEPQEFYWYRNLEKELGKKWTNLKDSLDISGRSNTRDNNWAQFCLVNKALTEFAYKIEDFRLRMNTVDCTKFPSLPKLTREPEIISNYLRYEQRASFEVDENDPLPFDDTYKENTKNSEVGHDLKDTLDKVTKNPFTMMQKKIVL